MADEIRSELAELRLQLHQLARENAELRAYLAGEHHRPGDEIERSGQYGPYDALTPLPRRELRRRRWKGRMIALALLALGVGVGLLGARVVSRERMVYEPAPSHAGHAPGVGPGDIRVFVPTPPPPPPPAPDLRVLR